MHVRMLNQLSQDTRVTYAHVVISPIASSYLMSCIITIHLFHLFGNVCYRRRGTGKRTVTTASITQLSIALYLLSFSFITFYTHDVR